MSERTVVAATAVSAFEDEIRQGVRSLCSQFSSDYWRRLDQEGAYPTEYVDALTAGGWLSIMIPAAYGGGGLGVTEGSVVLEEINRSGGNAGACHAQLYITALLSRHANDKQKDAVFPQLARGELRFQAFGVTESDAGSDVSRISTLAERQGSEYVINGRKVFTSRVKHSDLLLLLARTQPRDPAQPTAGLSLFLVDLREAGRSVEATPIQTMFNHDTYELLFNDLVVSDECLVGLEGSGFRALLDGLNAERTLLAAEAVGDGRWFCATAAAYSRDRVIFGAPIGKNQGVQFPLARAFMAVEAADLMRRGAAALYDANQPCGDRANMAKFLASEAAWEAANACMDTHGGYGVTSDYDVARKFRETRLHKLAPVANNLILAYVGERLLGMPRSY